MEDKAPESQPITLQSLYEAYMKKVTNAFVDMHSDQKSTGKFGHDGNTKVYFEVIWKGGLAYSFDLNSSWAMNGLTFDEIKEHNAGVALRYLQANTMVFDLFKDQFERINNLPKFVKTKDGDILRRIGDSMKYHKDGDEHPITCKFNEMGILVIIGQYSLHNTRLSHATNEDYLKNHKPDDKES